MKKALSILVSVCLLLSAFAGAAPAMATEEVSAVQNAESQTGVQSEVAAPVVAEEEEVAVLWEDETLRGEYEKHFLMSDGTYQAVVYSYPVHQLVDGVWVEIEAANPNARTDVSTDTTKSNIIDNYVLQGAGVQNKSLDRLYIGNRSAGLTRAYIQFAAMPTIPAGATITAATMTLHFTSGTNTAANASAYQVTGGEWTSGTIQWSNKPAANVLLQSNISHNNVTGYVFSCLTAVQHWYDGDTTGQNENYGIMLRYYNESTADYNAVYSADHTDATKRPSMTISYTAPNDEISVLEGYIKQLPLPDTTETITWTSSNTAVATVNSAGKVTGVKAGKVTITASAGGTELHTYTVYVKIEDGVYRIGFSDTDKYMGTNAQIADYTQVKILPYSTDPITQIRQLWIVKYLSSGYYCIRPICKRDMALRLNGNKAQIYTVGTNDAVAALSGTSRWLIEFDTDGYLIRTAAASDQALCMSSSIAYMPITTSQYSENNPNFRWRFEKATNTNSEVLLLDTDTGKSAVNVVRYISPGETVTLSDLEIVGTTACCHSVYQPISWSTSNTSVVSVNAQTGAVTGLTPGRTATIVAKHVHNGVGYEKYYTIKVQQRDAPVYVIKHYYDVGYGVRENDHQYDALDKIEMYHAVVAARFESIFNIEMYYTIEPIVSICDDCKVGRFVSVQYGNLDELCNHSQCCSTSESVRFDLFEQNGMGDKITSVVLWTGHRMTENEVSSSEMSSQSVVMTRAFTTVWNEQLDCYQEASWETKYKEETRTLFHELAHQLGTPDHYCYGAELGKKCENKSCDTCYLNYNVTRDCMMGQVYYLADTSDEEMFCEECETTIRNHLQDHH